MAASHLLESLLHAKAACFTSSSVKTYSRGYATGGVCSRITYSSSMTPSLPHVQKFSAGCTCDRASDTAVRKMIVRSVPDAGTELAVDAVSGIEAAPDVTELPKDLAVQDSAEELSLQEVQRMKPAPVVAKGAGIVDVLNIFVNLLERPFSAGATIAAAGYVVIEKVSADVEALSDDPKVNQQYVFELLRLAKLLSVDMDMVASARKLETLLERLQQATAHAKQAIQLAKAL